MTDDTRLLTAVNDAIGRLSQILAGGMFRNYEMEELRDALCDIKKILLDSTKKEGAAMTQRAGVGVHICTSSDMHPYECGGGCIHCRLEKTQNHDPRTCWLCHNGPPCGGEFGCSRCNPVKPNGAEKLIEKLAGIESPPPVEGEEDKP